MNQENDRIFDTHKSEQKLKVLQRWKSGEKVVSISDELGLSRDTVYRWLKDADRKLSKNSSRNRKLVDTATRNRILEAWVILAKPSMKRLSEALDSIYGIKKTEHQLRYLLNKSGLADYQPSAQHKSLMRLALERPSGH